MITPIVLCESLKGAGITLIIVGLILVAVGVITALRADIPLKGWLSRKPKSKPKVAPASEFVIIPDPRTKKLDTMLRQAAAETTEWKGPLSGQWYIGDEYK